MDLLLVVLGFSLIIVLHEAGHFVAARWAGIRVLAFAVGFGPALLSYRNGLGLRFGSSEKEQGDRAAEPAAAEPVSPTEYRLNWLPFGGYVKMLGQEDLDPEAVSQEPDSYQNCPPWKRMVVISAGVATNLVTGALLFVGVFMAGLEAEPPWLGAIEPGSPADLTAPINAAAAHEDRVGLQAGDRVLDVDGREMRSFHDLVLASVMSRRGEPLLYRVERADRTVPLEFAIDPEVNAWTGLREIGIRPPRTTRLIDPAEPAARREMEEALAALGWSGVAPGMELVRVGADDHVRSPGVLVRAVRESEGRPVEAEFAGDGKRVTVTVRPEPEYQIDLVQTAGKKYAPVQHLLGLTPLMKVAWAADRGREQGLRDSDIFVRIGDIDYPSHPQGVAEIRAHRGKSIELAVLRAREGDGGLDKVRLDASVTDEGTIGFNVEDASADCTILAAPREVLEVFGGETPRLPPAADLIKRPGTRVARVAGQPVSNFAELREALVEATSEAYQRGSERTAVTMTLADPTGEPGGGAEHDETWNLDRADLLQLHSLRFTASTGVDLFEPQKILLQASGPFEALSMGLVETKQMVATTYVTFARLFQGSVKVEQLKGPIGIAHVGTVVAQRGLIWLLFFMAMISINLAVINFLPLPIVDGGQFLFLLVEQIRGKPVSMRIQQAVTLVGLVLIGAIFLFITYNDIVGLVSGS